MAWQNMGHEIMSKLARMCNKWHQSCKILEWKSNSPLPEDGIEDSFSGSLSECKFLQLHSQHLSLTRANISSPQETVVSGTGSFRSFHGFGFRVFLFYSFQMIWGTHERGKEQNLLTGFRFGLAGNSALLRAPGDASGRCPAGVGRDWVDGRMTGGKPFVYRGNPAVYRRKGSSPPADVHRLKSSWKGRGNYLLISGPSF